MRWRGENLCDMVLPHHSMRLQLTKTTLPPAASGAKGQRGHAQAARPVDLKTFDVLRRTMHDYLLPNWKLVVISLIASTVVAASTGVLPLLIKFVFDDVLHDKNQSMLILVAVATVGASAFKGAASYGTNITKNLIGQKIISAIQGRLFARIIKADLAWVSGTHSGRFISSFMNDSARVRDAVTMSIIDFTQNLLTVIALMGAVFYLNWKLALLATSIIPIGILYMRKLGKKTRKAGHQTLEGAGNLSAQISEALGGIRVVKAYGQEDREIARVEQTIQTLLRHMMKGIKAKAAASPLTEALSGVGIGAVIYFGGMSVIQGALTSGELVAFISALMLAYQPLKAVANTQTIMQEGVAAATRVFPILDIEPEIIADPDASPLKIHDGAVKFSHVSFAYGDGTRALDDVSINIPKGHTVALVGPSGGGKSTLIIETLYKALARKLNKASKVPAAYESIEGLHHLDKVIDIDQSPIGRTPRSNPATYTGIFTPVRELFAGTQEARSRGYKPGRFSFNVKGGRCEACQGDGVIKVEMHFLPDIYVPCDVCKGKRYNRETLEVKYKGKNIHEVLDLTVEDARVFFDAIPALARRLQTLIDVGLSYIRLGQAATTLSGGEAQRIKLAKELSKRDTGQTLYILDEPTTGLHFYDIQQLLNVLNRLRDHGNTIVVIEHNLDVIKTADWIVDLGPEGGIKGGYIIAEGIPEDVAKNKNSYTGHFLKAMLK